MKKSYIIPETEIEEILESISILEGSGRVQEGEADEFGDDERVKLPFEDGIWYEED